MFNGAKSFNQDISKWQTKSLKYLYRTFSRAEKFNQDISNWDVSNVARFSRILYGAKSFNQDLSKWDINITRLAKFPGDKTGYDDWNKGTLIEKEKSKWPLNLQNVNVSIGNK
nr:BspA family leucine-rich repeat surface protein [Mycoplasmopsis bovis]